MSDVRPDASWWQASDGRFYPPHLHPRYHELVATTPRDDGADEPVHVDRVPPGRRVDLGSYFSMWTVVSLVFSIALLVATLLVPYVFVTIFAIFAVIAILRAFTAPDLGGNLRGPMLALCVFFASLVVSCGSFIKNSTDEALWSPTPARSKEIDEAIADAEAEREAEERRRVDWADLKTGQCVRWNPGEERPLPVSCDVLFHFEVAGRSSFVADASEAESMTVEQRRQLWDERGTAACEPIVEQYIGPDADDNLVPFPVQLSLVGQVAKPVDVLCIVGHVNSASIKGSVRAGD